VEYNKYQEQWELIQGVIQLLETDWISEGCFLGAEFDCESCKAILVRTILKEMQTAYYDPLKGDSLL